MARLPPRKKLKGFWNDIDGISARDYLLLISTGVFFLFVAIGLIVVLFQISLAKMYLSLLEMVSPVVMTIVAGVFSVQAVESFTKGKNKKKRKKEKIYRETQSVDDVLDIEEVEVSEEEQ